MASTPDALFREKAEGLAEQLTSLSLPDLGEKHDRGCKVPRAEITAPPSLTELILEFGGNDRISAQRFESEIYQLTGERIKFILKCTSVEVTRSPKSSPPRPDRVMRVSIAVTP